MLGFWSASKLQPSRSGHQIKPEVSRGKNRTMNPRIQSILPERSDFNHNHNHNLRPRPNIFGYSRFESVKEVIHGLGRLNIKHLLMMRKIKFYRHLHLSKNFLANLLCISDAYCRWLCEVSFPAGACCYWDCHTEFLVIRLWLIVACSFHCIYLSLCLSFCLVGE